MNAIRARLAPRLALALGLALLSGCAGTTALVPLRQEGGEAAQVIRSYREAVARQRAHAESEAEKQRAQSRSLNDLLRQGDQLRDAGDYAPALFAYLRAHTQSYEDVEPRLRIAFLHLREEPARAEAVFRKILVKSPHSAVSWSGLALAQLSQDRPADAHASLKRAVELDPQAAVPRSLLGVLLDRMGDHREAQIQYELALQSEAEDYVILNNLGVSYLLSHQPERAEEPLRKASYLEPRDPALRNNLGVALGLQRNYSAALTTFRAVTSEPGAQNNLGWVYYLNGDYAGAIAHFEKALDAEGDDLLVVLENIDMARTALETAPPQRGHSSLGPLGYGASSQSVERQPEPSGDEASLQIGRLESLAEPRLEPARIDALQKREDQISVAELRASLESEAAPAQETARLEILEPTLPAEEPGEVSPEVESAFDQGLPAVDETLDFGSAADEIGEIEFEWEDDFGASNEPIEDENDPTA